jgi:hypothetical protein
LTDLQSIEVREGSKKYYFFGLLVWIAILISFIREQGGDTIDLFSGKWSFRKLEMLLLFTVWPLYCLFFLFDKRIKLRIDKNGIWTIRNNNIFWGDIWYFSSGVYKMRTQANIYYFKVRLRDTETTVDKEIKIRLQRMDKAFEDIRSVIEYYAAKNNVYDMGHEVKN